MRASILFCLLFQLMVVLVRAQSGPPGDQQYAYARFSPSMAIIIVVLIAALFFMGFFSIYIRHCSDSSGRTGGSIRRALSLGPRRAAAARGLDPSVIEALPTFPYSEVKEHKIGKGSLECAVCLNEFEDDETIRLLPACDHVFHPECIDAWLGSHVTCPVCRANLAPQPGEAPGDDDHPLSAESGAAGIADDRDRDSRRNDEIAINVNENDDGQGLSGRAENSNRAGPGRSWSIRMPKVASGLGFGRFRSHSTGHSLVHPGENLERFTLRLPDHVRKEVMGRASLNRTGSLAVGPTLPREGSSSRARSYRRIEREGVRSDRWLFFTRVMSLRSPRGVAAEGSAAGEGSIGGGSGRAPVKMPSFKCLEPKARDDKTGLFAGEPV